MVEIMQGPESVPRNELSQQMTLATAERGLTQATYVSTHGDIFILGYIHSHFANLSYIGLVLP